MESVRDLCETLHRIGPNSFSFPICRKDVLPFVEKLAAVDPTAFLIFNYKTFPPLYCNQLTMSCNEVIRRLTPSSFLHIVEGMGLGWPLYNFVSVMNSAFLVDVIKAMDASLSDEIREFAHSFEKDAAFLTFDFEEDGYFEEGAFYKEEFDETIAHLLENGFTPTRYWNQYL